MRKKNAVQHIFRDESVGNFTKIKNTLIIDPELKDNDFRVLSYILTKPDFWVINPTEITRALSRSRNTVYASINRLIDLGYMKRTKTQTKKGFDYEYWAFDYRNAGNTPSTKIQDYPQKPSTKIQDCHKESEIKSTTSPSTKIQDCPIGFDDPSTKKQDLEEFIEKPSNDAALTGVFDDLPSTKMWDYSKTDINTKEKEKILLRKIQKKTKGEAIEGEFIAAGETLNDLVPEKPKKAIAEKKWINDDALAAIRSHGVEESVIAELAEHRRVKNKVVMTLRAFNVIPNQAKLAGITVQAAIEFMLEKQWERFRAEWYLNDKTSGLSKQEKERIEEQARMKARSDKDFAQRMENIKRHLTGQIVAIQSHYFYLPGKKKPSEHTPEELEKILADLKAWKKELDEEKIPF